MDKPASLGETIRERRLALGYSLGQLATKVNKTASSIRSWERGDSYPSQVEATELANALDLDPAGLLEILHGKIWDSEAVGPVAVNDPWNGRGPAPKEGDAKTSDAPIEDVDSVAAQATDEAEIGHVSNAWTAFQYSLRAKVPDATVVG